MNYHELPEYRCATLRQQHIGVLPGFIFGCVILGHLHLVVLHSDNKNNIDELRLVLSRLRFYARLSFQDAHTNTLAQAHMDARTHTHAHVNVVDITFSIVTTITNNSITHYDVIATPLLWCCTWPEKPRLGSGVPWYDSEHVIWRYLTV